MIWRNFFLWNFSAILGQFRTVNNFPAGAPCLKSHKILLPHLPSLQTLRLVKMNWSKWTQNKCEWANGVWHFSPKFVVFLATPTQLTQFRPVRLSLAAGENLASAAQSALSFFRENEARHGDATLGRWHLPEFLGRPESAMTAGKTIAKGTYVNFWAYK